MTFSRRTKVEADKARRAFHSNGSARRLKAQGYVIRAWKHETDPLRFYVKVEKGGRAASAGARR